MNINTDMNTNIEINVFLGHGWGLVDSVIDSQSQQNTTEQQQKTDLLEEASETASMNLPRFSAPHIFTVAPSKQP